MADTNRDGLDELTNSAMAASRIAKILQAAQAAGAAGAAAQTVKEFHRQAAVVIIVILLLPILRCNVLEVDIINARTVLHIVRHSRRCNKIINRQRWV